MEEISPALAMTLSLANSMSDTTGIRNNPLEIARLKLGIDATDLAEKHGAEPEEDEILSVVEDPNGVISEGLVVLDPGSELKFPDSLKIENGRIIAKAIILGESSVEQVPTAEVLITPVSPDVKHPNGSDLKASAVVIQLPVQRGSLPKEVSRSIFEVDCIPLWGSVSICGRRPEMEDAVAAVPRFMKIPIKMLIGDHVIDGMNKTLNSLTSHFFGVYDGHGGSQVRILS